MKRRLLEINRAYFKTGRLTFTQMGGKSGVLPSLSVPPRPPFALADEAAKESNGTYDTAEHLNNLRCDGRRCVESYCRGCADVFRHDRVFATPGWRLLMRCPSCTESTHLRARVHRPTQTIFPRPGQISTFLPTRPTTFSA